MNRRAFLFSTAAVIATAAVPLPPVELPPPAPLWPLEPPAPVHPLVRAMEELERYRRADVEANAKLYAWAACKKFFVHGNDFPLDDSPVLHECTPEHVRTSASDHQEEKPDAAES